ncbi:MAG: malto-oligosyltrehalose trehalohydrolase [Acidimicrobiia bacterium]
MTALRLWAPFALKAAVRDAEGSRHSFSLAREDDGWWVATRPLPERYYLVVDGVTMPDPTSRAQPSGLDGPSAQLGPFAWHDDDWRGFPLKDAVLYEIHTGTFTIDGTFDGIVERLDHLVGVGVNAIELMPVNTFPGTRGWGYDGALLYAVHEAYGGPDGLRRLVDACHGRGIAVVLDVVYNHFGPTGNHLAKLGPYFTAAHHTPWGDAVNLDQEGSAEVRQFFVENALMWIRDFHIDGLRLDAVHAFRDDSPEPFLRQITDAVHDEAMRLGRTVWMIAESDLNDARLVDRDDPHAPGHFDAVWDDDFHHALHATLTGERDGYYASFDQPWDDIAVAVNEVYVRPPRHEGGAPAGQRDRHRFVVSVQNHDQIGNRALGERLGRLTDQRAAEAAAALMLLSPFTPLLFMGEEWMASTPFQYFTDHRDPDIAAAVTAGRRSEFADFSAFDTADVPDPQDAATFANSRLDWKEATRLPHAAVVRWYTRLVELRRRLSDTPPITEAKFDRDLGLFTMMRGGRLSVVVNTGDRTADLGSFPTRATVLLTNDASLRSGVRATQLGPRCTAIVNLD